MIDGREPDYICLDVRALNLVRLLSDSERLMFFDGIMSAYRDKLESQESFAFPDGMVGELLRQATDTLTNGFDSYMKRVNANLSGKRASNPMATQWVPNDNPMGTQWEPNAPQSNLNQDHINQDQINQIRSQLREEGFTDSEIDSALDRCSGKRVSNITAYVRKTITNERRERIGKPVSAQNYSQRQYEDRTIDRMNDVVRLGQEIGESDKNNETVESDTT